MNLQDIYQHYISTPDCELSASVVSEFRQFIVDLAQVELQGINCQYVDYFPYLKGGKLFLEDIHADFNQGILKITNLFNNSALLGPEINLLFRSIHEVHHLQLNMGFGLEGEFATAAHIISLTDNPLFKQILFSETMGQVATCLCTGDFPEFQKVVMYPLEVVHGMSKGWRALL